MSSLKSKLHNFFKTPNQNDTTAAMETKVGSYDDFEPFCNWSREEGAQTLVLHLPEFKKEQLKVHINSVGTVRINGERPLDATKSKLSRFCKEIKIPKNCNANEINAKFAGGLLYIVMPNKISTSTSKSLQKSQDNRDQTSQAQAQVSKKPTLNATANAADKLGGSQAMDNKPGIEFSVTRSKRGRKVAINVAVVVVPVLLALGAYMIYRYTTSSHFGTKPSHHLEMY